MQTKSNYLTKILSLLLALCILLGISSDLTVAMEDAPIKAPATVDFTKSAVRIATVGDSITYGADPNDWNGVTYPRIMQGLLGPEYFVYNFGWYGTTALNDTPDAYTKNSMFERSKAFQPNVVIIMLGSNDAKGKYWSMDRKEEYKNDLKKLIKTYADLDSHPIVFLASSPTVRKPQPDDPEWIDMNFLNNEVYPAQLEVVEETGVKYIDIHTATADLGTAGDGVHGFYPEIAAEMTAGLTSDADFTKFTLNNEIVSAKTSSESDYTADSLAELELEIQKATETLANTSATLSEVKQATFDIIHAQTLLEFRQPIDHPTKLKVAAIGDSITYGAYANQSYPSQLQTLLGDGYEVRNFGVNGRTMLSKGDYPYIGTQEYKDSLAYNPDVVIIMLGTNDSKPQNWQYKNEFRQNAIDLINQYRNLPTHPIVFLATSPSVHGPNNMGITSAVVDGEVIPAQKAIAQELGLNMIDTNIRTYGMGVIFPDTVHGNDRGYLEIAKIMKVGLDRHVGLAQKALRATFERYSQLDSNRFTPESWEAFQEVVGENKSFVEKPASIAQISEVKQRLWQAEKELVYVVDNQSNLARPDFGTTVSTDSELSAYPLVGILEDNSKTFWGTDKNINPNIAHAEFSFNQPVAINRVDIREHIPSGWGSVARYTVEIAATDSAPYVCVASGNQIGTETQTIHIRIQTAKKVRLTFYPDEVAKLGGMNFEYIGIFGFPEINTQQLDKLLNYVNEQMIPDLYDVQAWAALNQEIKNINMLNQLDEITQQDIDLVAKKLDATIQKMEDYLVGIVVDDQDTSIVYTGALNGEPGKIGGSAPTGQTGCYNESLHWANSGQGESTITYTFTGTGISILSSKNVYFGILDIQIDDGKSIEVDCYDPSTTVIKYQNVFSKRDLPFGEHTIKITGGIKKSAISIGTKIEFDGFYVYDERETANKTDLKALIEKVDKLSKADYTEQSWNKLEKVLKEAQDVLSNKESTQVLVDETITKLQTAINNLVPVGNEGINKVALQIAIELAGNANLDNVIPTVIKEFNEALEYAIAINDKTNATQEEVDKSFDRLAKIMQMLEFFKGDKKALNDFINKVKDLKDSEYTEGTWKTFQAVLATSRGVSANDNSMQAEVDQTYTELVKAFVNLKYKPNKDLLKDLVNQANGLDATNYTVDSWRRLANALNGAKAALDNPEATVEEVDNVNNALTKALAGLVARPVKPSSKVNGKESAVKTGDNNLIGVFAGLAILSITGMIGYCYRKKIKR